MVYIFAVKSGAQRIKEWRERKKAQDPNFVKDEDKKRYERRESHFARLSEAEQ